MANLLASTDSETFTPEQLFAGSADIVTQAVTVLSGQNLTQYSVVGRVSASGKIKLSARTADDGSEVPVGILVNAINASGGDKAGTIYIGGDFNRAALVWDATYDTEAKKAAAFDGTNITTRNLAYSVG